ncbi:MAG: PPC domain-containing protein, partial [Limnospira sp. PMC 1254.20]|uniref:PPC domain-containing protein n=1 Tax=Limnospira sp. PMC 1254.20 TaxID=2981052 RepID=UPI0028E1817E
CEDRFAPNHSFEAAHDFGTVTSQLVQNELVIVSGNDDWFSFTTNGTAGSGAEVRIDFLHSLGDVDMRLYDANNNWLGSSTSVSDNESISLAGLGAGTYYVRVWGWSGASNPNYSLTIDPRVVSADGGEDRFAPNHSFEAAHDFGTVTSQLVQNELVIVSGND